MQNSTDHEIELINTHDQPCLTKPQPYPWLILSDGAYDNEDDVACGDDLNKERHIFYSIGEDHYYEVRGMSRFLQGKYVTCCYHGWLVLEDYISYECQLYNLSTSDYLNLPPHNNYPHPLIVMSSSKIDTKCRFLFLARYDRTVKSCYVDDTNLVELMLWPDSNEKAEDPEFFGVIAATNFKGKLYIMSSLYNLMSANFSDPDLHLTTVIGGGGGANDFINLGTNFHFPDMPIHRETRFYLVESCGELLFIYHNSYNNEVENFKIFKSNFNELQWERVENLGDRALFLDYYKGLSTSSYGALNLGLKPNSIYFVNKFGFRNLYIYDLEDESITLTVPCPIVSASKVSLFWATMN